MNNIKQVVDSKACVGCGCCVAICPTNCIVLKETEGFYYPKIKEEECIQCGKCEDACAIIDEKLKFNTPFEWYAGYADEKNMPKMSTSGGVCSLISKNFIEKGKSVYAASFDNGWNLSHKRVENVAQLEKFDGSKYVQSMIPESVYQKIGDEIKAGKECLFIGTPCQIAGIREYVNSYGLDINRLCLIDFICHGVPSPILGKRFLKYLEEKKREKIVSYNFRSKYHGWGKMYRAVTFAGKRENVISCSYCPLHEWFGKHFSVRPSCFSCQYRKIERVSDITVADFWGIERHYPDVVTKQGVSAIQINTEKGKQLYSELVKTNSFVSIMVSKESIWDRKIALNNYPMPEEYHMFWKDAEMFTIDSLIKKYPPQTFWGRAKQKIKLIFKLGMESR